MSTETDIVERLARIIDPEAMAEYEAGFGRGGPTYDQLAVYPRVKAARLKASGLLPAVRAERDAAARDMQERCAKVADAKREVFLSPQYATGQPMSSAGERFACSQIADEIRALPTSVIATDGGPAA